MLKTSMQDVSFGGDGYPGNWARICDSCLAAPCTIYCHTESAYLCHRCDEYIHAADPTASQHERVWLCTACENAEAAFICHADAASLCVKCDLLIHSANQLAYRHNRVPIPPLSGIGFSSSSNHLQKPQGGMPAIENETLEKKCNNQLEEDETSSWLLLDLDTTDNLSDSVFTYDGKVNEYLDVMKYNSCGEHQCQDQRYDQQQLSSDYQEDNGSDSVVPVQSFKENEQQQKQIYVNRENEAAKDACISNSSISQTSCEQDPMSLMDAGYLLEATTTDISNSYHPRLSEGTTNLFPSLALLKPLQFGPTKREARVLRYKEKRKVRKFEKKIRYAARKANAENRPRVKGRFARKTRMEFEMDVDKMFSTEDCGYGIVPSN